MYSENMEFVVLLNVNFRFQMKLFVMPIPYPIGRAIKYARNVNSVRKNKMLKEISVPDAPIIANLKNC